MEACELHSSLLHFSSLVVPLPALVRRGLKVNADSRDRAAHRVLPVRRALMVRQVSRERRELMARQELRALRAHRESQALKVPQVRQVQQAP